MIILRLFEGFSDAEVAIVAAIVRAGGVVVGKDDEAERLAVRINLDLADAVRDELTRREITPQGVGERLLGTLRKRLLERYDREDQRHARE